MNSSAKFSESYCILLRDFLFRDMKYQDDSNKNTLYTPHFGFFWKQKVSEATFHLIPQKSDTNHQEKNHSQKPFIGKTWKISRHYHGLIFFGHFDCATASSSKAFMLMTPHGASLEKKLHRCHGTIFVG